ncbi:uncharacterized protein LOC135844904 [Planococcus citri]|uniref:uncharacterized protein LOC135844904 n=1 Tax=Planococcus citri TaxID=170843 RepID=UPI0031F934B9
MNILSEEQFVEKLSKKLHFEEVFAEKASDLAKEIIDQLLNHKNLPSDVNRLTYSKIVVHSLLLSHDFTLNQPTTFNLLDDGILKYKYTYRHRTEFLYNIVYNVEAQYVLVYMIRLLGDEYHDCVTVAIVDQPEFSNDSMLQDCYRTEKLLISLLKKWNKLWTNFRKPTGLSDSETSSSPDRSS